MRKMNGSLQFQIFRRKIPQADIFIICLQSERQRGIQRRQQRVQPGRVIGSLRSPIH